MIIIYLLLSVSFGGPVSAPSHRLAVADGGTLTLPTASFAVVGNTRQTAPFLDKGRTAEGTYAPGVVGDIIVQGLTGSLDFVVHTGDMVPASTAGAWREFGEQMSSLLDGSSLPPSGSKRYPIIPVVGDRDCAKDSDCATLANIFPGFGVDIGFGRVATWQSFDLKVGDSPSWKFIILDTNKKGLGSRWNEQLSWLSEQARNPKSGLLIFMHEPPKTVGPNDATANAKELVEHIENYAPLMSIKAIFSAGPSLTQALLPEGAFGSLHCGAGGGGTPTIDLNRGLVGDDTDALLAPGYNDAIDALITSYEGATNAPSSRILDEARGYGTFKGFPRRMDGAAIPTHGWWKVEITPTELTTTWRARQPDGTFRNQAKWRWNKESGWTSSSP